MRNRLFESRESRRLCTATIVSDSYAAQKRHGPGGSELVTSVARTKTV
ncbi:MAG TPA: hypothetical protein VF669_00405 [Tepidisphaeraceae bacterium]